MPNSWWEWGDNLAEQVENLEEENEMLYEKVFCLESNVDFLKKKLNNVLTLLARMQPQESSSNTNGENNPVACANKWNNPWDHELCKACGKGDYITRSQSSTGHGYCTNDLCIRSHGNKERKARRRKQPTELEYWTRNDHAIPKAAPVWEKIIWKPAIYSREVAH